MSSVDTMRLRLRALFAPRRVERDLHDELAFHLEMETRKHIAAGLTPEAARQRALARFGSSTVAADACRDARGITLIDTTLRDVSYAFRSFRRTPAVALTVIGTIALGLGLLAAVFTVLNAMVFRPDAIPDPGSLFSFNWSTREQPRHRFTLREYEDFRRDNDVFADMAARNFDLTTRIEGRAAEGQLVTGNFFQVLGVNALLGRTLVLDDAAATGREAVIVLSYLAWQRMFGGDPGVIGRTVRVNGFPCEVVGVTPQAFRGLEALLPIDFWAPLTMIAELDPRRTGRPPENPGGLEVLGRLKPGISESRARAALTLWVSRNVAGDRPAVLLTPRGTSSPLSLSTLLGFSPFFVAFGLILLIGCANVSNLMLARAFARQREIAIRLSLGASRGRVVRQLLTESLLLSLGAAAAGLLISRAVVDAARHFLSTTMPAEIAGFFRLDSVPLPSDWRVAGFLVFAAAVSASLFGLVPALQATRVNLLHAARDTTERVGSGRRGSGRIRSALIVVQVTASALLLISAGIFLRAGDRAAAVDSGMRISDTIVIDNPRDERLRPAMLQALAAEPIVVSFTASWPGTLANQPRQALGSPIAEEAMNKSAAAGAPAEQPAGGELSSPTSYRFVSAEYFDVLGIDVLSGRVFTRDEAAARAAVAVVSEATARQFWPGGSAVGRWLRVADTQPRRGDEPLTAPPAVLVLGVVRDVRGFAAADNGADNTGIYLPATTSDAGTAFVVRAHGDPEQARQTLTTALGRVEPNLGMMVTMRTLAALRTYPMQLAFWVVVLLGSLALVLTLSGIYGVLSYLVLQRTKEIGVRMALGATAGAVTRLVLWQSLRVVALGLGAGVGLAWGLSTVLISLLPATGLFAGLIDLFDGVAYGASLLTILTACALAAAVPALRAARIDPIATLRHD